MRPETLAEDTRIADITIISIKQGCQGIKRLIEAGQCWSVSGG